MRADQSIVDHEFNQVVRRFEIPLLHYANRILQDRDRAQDVVQETFVELRRANRIGGNESPAKWLFTVCRNRALNVCRKERRTIFLEQNVMEQQAAHEIEPWAQLEHKEATRFLSRIIETLPARQQEVLQLKFQNDLTYQEISEITHLSVSNVGFLIHTALKTLRQKFGKTSRHFVAFEPRPIRHD